jgi:putative transposase
VFFVTFCTRRRRRLLANTNVHTAFRSFAISAYRDHNIAVRRYVIMPEHVHLFICGPDEFVLGRWIGSLKQALAKAIASRASAGPMWQRGFFDHVLRSDDSYSQKWDYVRENPVRAGLVTESKEWSYSGEIVAIDRA